MIDTRTTIPVRGRGGFTLTELMISIALVLLILVGVNLIFRTTADTISAGQALNEAPARPPGLERQSPDGPGRQCRAGGA